MDYPIVWVAWLKGQRGQQPENMLGADFIPHIRPRLDRESPHIFDSSDRYIATTRHLLKKTWFQGVYYRAHDLLSVVFNTPHVAGRKILDALQLYDVIPRITMPDMRKTTIAAAVEETFSADARLVDLYVALTADANVYRDVLISQIPQLTEEEYDQIITATLDNNLPKTIELLRRMQEEYRRLGRERGIGLEAITAAYVEGGASVTREERDAELITELRMAQFESCH